MPNPAEVASVHRIPLCRYRTGRRVQLHHDPGKHAARDPLSSRRTQHPRADGGADLSIPRSAGGPQHPRRRTGTAGVCVEVGRFNGCRVRNQMDRSRCSAVASRRRSSRRRQRAKLSDARDHARHSLCAGRLDLDRRPRHRRQDERTARRKGRGRQPPRRRRHRRHQGGRQERARRLHAGARLHRHARDRALALQECRLRSAQGFRADRPDRQCAELAGGESVVSRPKPSPN